MDSEIEDSPLWLTSTQEESAHIDVIWDWNSPQSKKCQKKLSCPQPPKMSIKRYPSNHAVQDFEKLREELKALRDEISIPEHEECLMLSPNEEAEYKNIDDDHIFTENIFSQPVTLNIDNLFDDSLDEELVTCIQKIENEIDSKLIKVNKVTTPLQNSKSFKFKRNQSVLSGSIQNIVDLKLNVSNHTKPLLRTKSDNYENTLKRAGTVEFHRTQSFELSNMENLSGADLKMKMEEIEKKRKEARAKLESKKNQAIGIISPSQCSLEEIEQKRLQAIAKRHEAKRRQEIIERKRQEALKRLEMNRQKNAMMVKSSLSSRLNY